MIVEKIPILRLVFLFVLYLVSHYFIGRKLIQTEEENKVKPGNPETQKEVKTMTFIFKWYPAAYLIFVVLLLILG